VPDVDLNELERYLRIYQENPDSRVFAPLADMYRRLARYREAEQICREGLQRHPYYAGGKVALAFILFDTGRLEEAHVEVESVVTYYPDNLMARKILVRVLSGMNQREKAEREYQALLQLAPQLAGDPELERALRGPVVDLVDSWADASAGEAQKRSIQILEAHEKTELDPEIHPQVPHRGWAKPPRGRREILLKKKRVLERWLGALEARRV
jgi:tetratricopeptide (TPR) repeat protein